MDAVTGNFVISEIQSSPDRDEGRMYTSCVRSNMIYGSESRPLLANVGLTFERTEMHMMRWMCGVSIRERRTSGEFRKLAGVEPISTFLRSGRPIWYGHVMRKRDEDWVKKCMECRVEGRRPVGRPIRTCLVSVEADMAELEIDREDVLDRMIWRNNIIKLKYNPIGKRTINRYYTSKLNLFY